MIKNIEYIVSLKDSNYIGVKNEGEDKLLIFDYKIAGNITPLKVIALEKSQKIVKVAFNAADDNIIVYNDNGSTQIVKLKDKVAI
jgi:hypothetical protein